MAKSPYSKITLFQTGKKHIKVIHGLDNSAISTCSCLHRWSSVECILLLKLSWHYWESWLRVKEMSKPSSSAKLSAMNTECTGEQREDYHSPHSHCQVLLSYLIFHEIVFRHRREVSERLFMSWPGGAISGRRSLLKGLFFSWMKTRSSDVNKLTCGHYNEKGVLLSGEMSHCCQFLCSCSPSK